MNKQDFWRNFSLNRELHVSGGFIYDGMRELKALQTFGNADEVFQILYPLAIGFERLLKIAIVLLEYECGMDQGQFEKSLITHSHLDLLQRVKAVKPVQFGPEHNELLQILGKFYKSYRYDRFSINSVFSESSETDALLGYLAKHVATLERRDELFGEAPRCSDEVRIFLAGVCRRLSTVLYRVVEDAARAVNLYTYEIRCDSKAFKVFMSEELDFFKEDLLWKEILVFLMNTRAATAELKFIREIEPLDLDLGAISEYLECLGSDTKKIGRIEELNELYQHIKNPSDRKRKMGAIGSGMYFLDDDEEVEQSEGP